MPHKWLGWSEYRNQQDDAQKTDALKAFIRKVKNIRDWDQPCNLIFSIIDADGQTINRKGYVKIEMGDYFEELRNPNEVTRDTNVSSHTFWSMIHIYYDRM